ncbi:uncharacterized protein [Chironomus tepperi]|uniref:uncharacterized protein n=1 Tax=Chironomus tepperi TaxID=113505 RepID=UPI00391F7A72
MRKVWISRDQLIPKPFYKRKLFFFFTIVLIFALIFIIYQFIFINQLATNNRIELLEGSKHDVYRSHKLVDVKPLQPAALDHKKIPLGIRIRDLEHYQHRYPNQLFKCLNSPDEEISFSKINDDYCDCSDGTDETSTNACNNGKFYCTKQLRHKTGRGQDVFIPTSRINDKICDCADCSDEFNT